MHDYDFWSDWWYDGNLQIIDDTVEACQELSEKQLNAFGNYLIKKSIQLKSSNHVAETVTNFLNETK